MPSRPPAARSGRCSRCGSGRRGCSSSAGLGSRSCSRQGTGGHRAWRCCPSRWPRRHSVWVGAERSRATVRSAGWRDEARTAGQPFHLARRPRLHRRHLACRRARRRPERARLAVGHGPLLPDLGGRAARARHARGLHDARARRRGHREHRAGHPGDRGDLPAPRHPAEDRHHARRALRRPRLAGHRRGVERGGAPRARRALPLDPRAVPRCSRTPCAWPTGCSPTTTARSRGSRSASSGR